MTKPNENYKCVKKACNYYVKIETRIKAVQNVEELFEFGAWFLCSRCESLNLWMGRRVETSRNEMRIRLASWPPPSVDARADALHFYRNFLSNHI